MPKTTKHNSTKARTALQGSVRSSTGTKSSSMAQNTPTDSKPLNGSKSSTKKGCGAPKGNMNSVGSGLRSNRILVMGEMPKSMKYIQHRINRFRRGLEKQVLQTKGELSMTDDSIINTVCKWERHGMLAQRWLRLEGDDLKPADKLNFSREIARASTERDKAIAQLDLDAPPVNPWEIDVEANND